MPGDLVLTLALAVGVCGMVQFPSSPRRTTDVTRMILDGIVIGGSILLVADVTLFPDLLLDNPGGWPLLVVPGHRRGARDARDPALPAFAARPPMLGLLAASFFCFAASDFGFAFVSASGRQFTYGSRSTPAGCRATCCWSWPSGRQPVRSDDLDDASTEKSPVLGTAVMFGLFLVALGHRARRASARAG